jgi:hypothetical protein
LLTACSKPWPDWYGADGQLLISDEKYLSNLDSLQRFASSGPPLSDCDLDVMSRAFDAHVFMNATGTPLPRKSIKFKRSEFESRFRNFKIPENTMPLVAVRYGLDFSGYVTCGIGFCWADIADRKVVAAKRYYEVLSDGTFDSPPLDSSDWISAYGSRYTNPSSVFISRNLGETPQPFVMDVDTRIMYLEAYRVSQFLLDNPSADVLELVSYSDLKRITTNENGVVLSRNIYHHGVAMVPWLGSARQVGRDDQDPDSFTMRALDLGSPCPENCAKFRSRYDRPVVVCPPVPSEVQP